MAFKLFIHSYHEDSVVFTLETTWYQFNLIYSLKLGHKWLSFKFPQFLSFSSADHLCILQYLGKKNF